MRKLILIRHGESVWNQENRFTGWADIDLTEKGLLEAQQAGRLLRECGLEVGRGFTSYLKRAVKTLNSILEEMNLHRIPVEKSRRLNERHFWVLQGLKKTEVEGKYGKEQFFSRRMGYSEKPPALGLNDDRAPQKDKRYGDLGEKCPLTESLSDCVDRAFPYFQDVILPALKSDMNVLVVAHGAMLREIIKVFKQGLNQEDIQLYLPNALPYVLEFDENMLLIKDYFLVKEDGNRGSSSTSYAQGGKCE